MNIIVNNISAILQKIYDAHKFMLWQRAHANDLTPLQIQVLLTIDQKKGCTLSTLASILQLSKPTLTDTIRSLEYKGLIQKNKCPRDSRTSVISFSKEGRKLIQSIGDYNYPVKQAISAMSTQHCASLQVLLLQVIQGLEQSGVISLNRMCFTCSHYMGDKLNKHHCSLLKRSLGQEQLQLDCAEHIQSL